jgi:hypothetical protein
MQEARRNHGTALEIEVAGLPGFNLIIWPVALQKTLVGDCTDSKDAILGWIVRRPQ